MNDKIVTHADLPVLREVRQGICDGDGACAMDDCPGSGPHPASALLDRLIAAAEADAPPLPEGWVVLSGKNGEQTVYWHDAGRLFVYRASVMDREGLDVAGFDRDLLTPLRPTVTEADLAAAWRNLVDDQEVRGYISTTQLVNALKAAGIEVV